MKKLMIRVVVQLALAAGAALALASTASAIPQRTSYMQATSLRSNCTFAGGYFNADPNGGSHYCVLPDGRVIICHTGTRTCVVLERTAPKPDNYWTPPNSDGLQVQGDPGHGPEITPVTAGVRTVRLAQSKG